MKAIESGACAIVFLSGRVLLFDGQHSQISVKTVQQKILPAHPLAPQFRPYCIVNQALVPERTLTALDKFSVAASWATIANVLARRKSILSDILQ